MKRPHLLRRQRSVRAPVQRRSRLRRAAVLRAALTRFGRDGYERASIRGIARQAGVSTGAVYQFFRSKRHLLLVTMDALLERLAEIGPPPFAGNRSVLEILEGFLGEAFSRERPFVGAYRAWREAALTDARIAAQDRRIRAWTRMRLHNLFRILAGLPGARPGLDLPVLAELWDRFFWDLLADPPSDRPRAVRNVAQTLFHALFADGRLEESNRSRTE